MNWIRTAAVLFLLGVSSQACPGCKLLPTDSVVSKDSVRQQQRANEGLSWSVLFMLMVPMGLIGGAGTYVVRTCREVDAAHQNRLK